MSMNQVSKTNPSVPLSQVSTNKPTETTHNTTQTGSLSKSSGYGPKSSPINTQQYIDHDSTQKEIMNGIDATQPGKILKNAGNVPKPGFFLNIMTMFQGVFPKTKEVTVGKIVPKELVEKYEALTEETSLEMSQQHKKTVTLRLMDTLGLTIPVPKLHEWQYVIEENTGLKEGVEYLHKALSKLPDDVQLILKEKRGEELLVALINNHWIKETLSECIMLSDKSTGYFGSKRDYEPKIFGYLGNCNHSSFVMKYMLLQFAEQIQDPGTKTMFEHLEKYGSDKHTYLKYEVSPSQSFCLDPTIRQFQMNALEYHVNFDKLSDESKLKILDCKMIFWGPSQDHLKEIEYLDARIK